MNMTKRDQYVMCFDVRVLKSWSQAFGSSNTIVALRLAKAEEKRSRALLEDGVPGSSALVASALWCVSEVYALMGRMDEAKETAGELLEMMQGGDDIGSMSHSSCMYAYGMRLYYDVLNGKDKVSLEKTQDTAQRCLNLLLRALEGISDERGSAALAAVSACFLVLGRWKDAEDYLLAKEKGAKDDTRVLSALSKLYFGKNWEKGLIYARRFLAAVAPGDDKETLAQAMYHMSVHLFYRGPQIDNYEEFYYALDNMMAHCRAINPEGGNQFLMRALYSGRSPYSKRLLLDDMRFLRSIAIEKNLYNLMWSFNVSGVNLTTVEFQIMKQERVSKKPKKHCCHCALLKDSNTLKMCSLCMAVGYCSRKCQKAAWGLHKKVCVKLSIEKELDTKIEGKQK